MTTDTGYRYLLDTSTVSALIKEPIGPVQQRIRQAGEELVCTSIVVVAELRFCVEKSRSQRLADSLNAILSALPVLPMDSGADHHYAALRLHLEQHEAAMESNDMLIAAHALAHGLTVVSDDINGFAHALGLATENWLGKAAQ